MASLTYFDLRMPCWRRRSSINASLDVSMTYIPKRGILILADDNRHIIISDDSIMTTVYSSMPHTFTLLVMIHRNNDHRVIRTLATPPYCKPTRSRFFLVEVHGSSIQYANARPIKSVTVCLTRACLMTSESRARLTPRYIAYCRRRPFELQVTLQPRGLLSH